MTEYQPLTLKASTAVLKDGSTAQVKRGVVMNALTAREPDGYQSYSIMVLSKDYYAVYVAMPGQSTWTKAGRVYKLGIGRWGIKSYGADSKPQFFDGVEHQPQGYEDQGTLAQAVETVVHGFLSDVEYAARQSS